MLLGSWNVLEIFVTKRVGTPVINGSLGISIDSAVFAGLTNVTNRHTDTHTDHATKSVAVALILCDAT